MHVRLFFLLLLSFTLFSQEPLQWTTKGAKYYTTYYLYTGKGSMEEWGSTTKKTELNNRYSYVSTDTLERNLECSNIGQTQFVINTYVQLQSDSILDTLRYSLTTDSLTYYIHNNGDQYNQYSYLYKFDLHEFSDTTSYLTYNKGKLYRDTITLSSPNNETYELHGPVEVYRLEVDTNYSNCNYEDVKITTIFLPDYCVISESIYIASHYNYVRQVNTEIAAIGDIEIALQKEEPILNYTSNATNSTPIAINTINNGLSVQLSQASKCTIAIYSLSGREIFNNILNLDAGTSHLTFPELSTGIYIANINSREFQKSLRFTIK